MYSISWKNAEGRTEYAKVVAKGVIKAIDFALTKGATYETIDYVNADEVEVIE